VLELATESAEELPEAPEVPEVVGVALPVDDVVAADEPLPGNKMGLSTVYDPKLNNIKTLGMISEISKPAKLNPILLSFAPVMIRINKQFRANPKAQMIAILYVFVVIVSDLAIMATLLPKTIKATAIASDTVAITTE